MTEEQKQLLLQDICARLPYKVICTDLRHGDSKITEVDIEDGLVYCFDFDEWVKVENCHLYLRPMESMTEEEKKEFDEFICIDEDAWLEKENGYANQAIIMSDGIDWLNEHHFDYRGLIPMGLALEAPENMYN